MKPFLPSNPAQQLNAVMHYYHQGNYAQAEQLCRAALNIQRNNPAALQLLGIVATAQGATREAITALEKAIKLVPRDPAICNSLANAYVQAGELTAAEKYYRTAIHYDPGYVLAYQSLGAILARDEDNWQEAIECFDKAIALEPNLQTAYATAAQIYLKRGDTHQALAYARHALEKFGCGLHASQLLEKYALDPGLLVTLGNIYRELEDTAQAEACYNQALTHNPTYIDASVRLALLLTHQHKYMQAMKALEQARGFNPKASAIYLYKGHVYEMSGDYGQAIKAYQAYIAANSKDSGAYYRLARVYVRIQDHSLAKASLQTGLAMDARNYADLVYFFDEFLSEPEHLRQALELGDTVIEQMPDKRDVLFLTLGWLLGRMGVIDGAINAWRKTRNPLAHSAALLYMHYLPGYSAGDIYAAHQAFEQRFALPLTQKSKPYRNLKQADRKLRVGYISQDFRKHSVAYFLEPVLAHHDPEQVEIFCYYNWSKEDEVSARFKRYATGGWRQCHDWADQKLAQTIRNDKIDILVDLMGHTGENRILLFARKPAPVQFSYLGYSDTTGLSAIDYRITDAYVEPEEMTLSAEKPLRMPASYFCYRPADETADIPVNSPPSMETGRITFASFNLPRKISDINIQAWKQILDRLPQAKLLLKLRSPQSVSENYAEFLKHRFISLGIPRERFMIADYAQSMSVYMHMYHKVDICLDSYPYNGATTTCESLWMGVPVISLSGSNHISRMGRSILSTIGLPELACDTVAQYVETAVTLAQDTERLRELQTTLRERMRASPLMDEAGFTRHLEALYRQAWFDYCASGA